MEQISIRHRLPGTALDPTSGVSWGRTDCRFGSALVVWSADGVCALEFPQPGEDREGHWREACRGAGWERDDAGARATVEAWISGGAAPSLRLTGTDFQFGVWRELVRLERGERCTYGELAERLGVPKAVRAVASAVARNPVSLWVPCHRVVPAAGGTGQYRWGALRKGQLLEWERAEMDFRK